MKKLQEIYTNYKYIFVSHVAFNALAFDAYEVLLNPRTSFVNFSSSSFCLEADTWGH